MLVPTKPNSLFYRSPKQKLLFLHVPKCGGSYIESSFAPHSKACPSLIWPETRGHLTYKQYEEVFDFKGESIHDYLILTVIRNPWSWHFSWFNYLKGDPDGSKSGMPIECESLKDLSFEEYLKWLDDPARPRSENDYLGKQVSDWICDENGRIMADIVLRQETLSDDLERIIRKLGLCIEPVTERVNQSTSEDYRKFYTNEMIEMVEQRHKRDLELFQYTY